MRLPYWCPADHVLRMHYWAGNMGPARPAMRIRYAEHSLLAHPAAAAAVSARVEVRAGGARAARCDECGDGGYVGPVAPLPPPREVVEVPAGEMDVAALRARLGRHVAAEHIHVDGELRRGGLDVTLSSGVRKAFDATIAHLGGGWCCVSAPPGAKPGFKGHYWYDMQFDYVPHTDRWGRRWGAERPWRPEPGP